MVLRQTARACSKCVRYSVSFRWASAVFLDNFTLAHRKLTKWKNMMVMLWLFSTNNTSPNIY